MDEGRLLSERSRRALPLIAVALTAAVLAGLVYLRSAAPRTTAPAPSRVPVMSGPYTASYDFISPQVGWAIVVDYAVLGSCRSPDLAECPSSSTFWIFKTTDGTKHWLPQYNGTGQGSEGFLHFFDPQNGLAEIGPSTYGTGDGGASWHVIRGPTSGHYPAPLLNFVGPTRGWAFAQDFVDDRGSAHGRLFSTRDGGATWTLLPAGVPSGAHFESVLAQQHPAFRESGEGWLGAISVSAPIVYNTSDGGATWHAIQVAPEQGEYFTRVALLPGAAVLVSTGLSTYVSSDRGATWHLLPQIPGTGIDDLLFIDATHWWESYEGLIYRTADAGLTWREVVASGFPEYWNFQTAGVIDTDHAWWVMTSAARSTENGLAMTSDGGAHWRMVNPPQPE
jgi:photosystem II stability/assembly factor-like uncharacterized protein